METSEHKISAKWLLGVFIRGQYDMAMGSAEYNGAMCLWNDLQHLGLINESRIEWDMDDEDADTSNQGKTA